MHVAITGASGLIGSALAVDLRADGHRVTSVVRRPVRSGEEAIAWDPMAGRLDPGDLEGVDAVVHLAGAGIGDHRWTDDYKRLVLESRTEGTATMARALSGLGAPVRFLSGSAIGFYGDRGDEVLTEVSGPGTGFLAEVVQAWEAAAAPAVDAGVSTAFVRTGIVLAPHGGALSKLLPLFRFGLGGRMGDGRQWWSWISLADEVAALRFLLEADVTGPVNLVAPGTVTNGEFTKVLGRVLGRPTVFPVPKFGPRLLRGAELADELLFASQRVQPTVLAEAGFRPAHPDLEGALRAVLHRPG